MDPKYGKVMQALLFATSVISIIAANILAGYYLGNWLDGYFSIERHTCRLIGTMAGVLTAFLSIYKIIVRDFLLPAGSKENKGKKDE
jgi:hypothetical protein